MQRKPRSRKGLPKNTKMIQVEGAWLLEKGSEHRLREKTEKGGWKIKDESEQRLIKLRNKMRVRQGLWAQDTSVRIMIRLQIRCGGCDVRAGKRVRCGNVSS